MSQIPLNDGVAIVRDSTHALFEACLPIRNVLCTLVNTLKDADEAIAGTYLRMSLWMESMLTLHDKRHFQAALHGARCLYELWVDLEELKRNPSLAEKLVAYILVAKYDAAVKEIDCRDKFGAKDTPSNSEQRAYIARNKATYDASLKKHWNGKPPRQGWNGNLATRTASMGPDAEMEYRSLYSILCWHSHAGLVGIKDVPPEGFEEAIAFAHVNAQKFYGLATNIVGDHFGIYNADPKIKHQVESYLSKLDEASLGLIASLTTGPSRGSRRGAKPAKRTPRNSSLCPYA